MQPHKVNGVEMWKVARGCEDKRRFPDEFVARTVGLEMRTTPYVYHCQYCRGWHLTSKRIEKSARVDYYLKEQA